MPQTVAYLPTRVRPLLGGTQVVGEWGNEARRNVYNMHDVASSNCD